jgi:hypothetical protein
VTAGYRFNASPGRSIANRTCATSDRCIAMYATTTFTTFTVFLPTIHISYLRILSSCNTTESIHHHLQLGRGESNSIPTEIVNGVVLSEESVTDDPQGTDGGGDVHTSEGRDTSSTSVEDVVGSLELVDLATEAE